MWSSLFTALAAIPFVRSSPLLEARQQEALNQAHCGFKNSDDPWKGVRAQLTAPASTNAIITVQTFVHNVVAFGQPLAPQAQIDLQIQILNDRYRPAGFQFNLNRTNFIFDDTGEASAVAGPALDRLQREEHQGGYDTLNIYIQGGLVAVNGQCTGPKVPPPGPVERYPFEQIYFDGCEIGQDTLPGGTALTHTGGITLVHEVGHWLGLLHPFPDDPVLQIDPILGCTLDADLIADTPIQRDPSFSILNINPLIPPLCPIGKDSCKLQPGDDNQDNYMDYSGDDCRVRFSQGQIDGMNAIFGLGRQGR